MEFVSWDYYSQPIGSMYAIYGIIYHQYTPNVSIYTIHGSYGQYMENEIHVPNHQPVIDLPPKIVIFHSYASLLEGTQKWKGPPNVMFVGL